MGEEDFKEIKFSMKFFRNFQIQFNFKAHLKQKQKKIPMNLFQGQILDFYL